MLLLPLIDYAVRIGLEPLPFGGSIEVCAGAHDMRLRVEVSHTGLQPGAEDGTSALLETLQRRLQGLYGAAASLELRSRTTRGVIATIEVPLEDTRDRR
jgi:LytS/YehU family sensor histidine kinase